MKLHQNFRDAAALQRIQDALWTTSGGTRASIMIGAGFSRLAKRASADTPAPPLWSDFTREMTESLYPGVDARFSPQDPLRLAQEYHAVHGGSGIDGLIRRLIRDGDWEPSEAHDRLVALPWANVLTTNWDTLLERAALRSLTRSYDVVRSPDDIPHTAAPRIVKLHGSLPSNTPFIFTEEDYRTYPRDFAPLVNLAQHVMMESVCCLIGFSGTDPNFLQWSGWVRDYFGPNAPTIYLVGALSISSSQRRMLEARNVHPVDLSPLVTSTNRDQQHADAVHIFLEHLENSEPNATYLWPHIDGLHPTLRDFHKIGTEKNGPTEGDIALTALPELQKLRKGYPGWVIAPSSARASIEYSVLPWKPIANRDFSKLTPRNQQQILYELAWLRATSFLPLDDQLISQITAILDSENSIEISESDSHQLAFFLLQDAREKLDLPSFKKWLEYLDRQPRKSSELGACIAFERCLLARDSLHLEGVEELIPQITTEDPIWFIRKAALLSELGAFGEVRETLKRCATDLRRRRSGGARSVWLDARFAWLSLLTSSLRYEYDKDGKPVPHQENEFLEDEKWKARYAEIKSDPWSELRALLTQLRDRKDAIEERKPIPKSLFDAGRYRPAQKMRFFGRDVDADITRTSRRIVDYAGVPSVHITFAYPAREIRAQCANLETVQDAGTLLRGISTIQSHDDQLIEVLLNRISVAQLSEKTAEQVSEALFKAVKFGLSKLRGSNNHNDVFWTEKVRAQLEIASRIAVRLSADTAKTWLSFALEFAESPECSRWWLFEPLNNLIRRSLEPLSPHDKKAITLGLFKFPLASERKVLGPDREWPEPSELLKATQIDRSDNEAAWSIRIQQLIEIVRQADNNSRTKAAIRLLVLHDHAALKEAELREFSIALWSRCDASTGLPSDTDLLPHVYLDLDQSKISVVESATRKKWPLSNPIEFSRTCLEEVMGLTAESPRHTTLFTLTESEIAAIIEAILSATVLEKNEVVEDRIFERNPKTDPQIRRLAGRVVAEGALPSLRIEHNSADTLTRLLECIEQRNAAHLIPALPELCRTVPSLAPRCLSALRRALKSNDEIIARHAYEGITRWLRRLERGALMPEFPLWLTSIIATNVSLRRRPGLYESLLCASKLLKMKMMNGENIELLVEGLSFLAEETMYSNFSGNDDAARAITLERELCVKIARSLIALGRNDPILFSWIESAKSDPLPEVRRAAEADL